MPTLATVLPDSAPHNWVMVAALPPAAIVVED